MGHFSHTIIKMKTVYFNLDDFNMASSFFGDEYKSPIILTNIGVETVRAINLIEKNHSILNTYVAPFETYRRIDLVYGSYGDEEYTWRKMKPVSLKRITDFLGTDKPTLVTLVQDVEVIQEFTEDLLNFNGKVILGRVFKNQRGSNLHLLQYISNKNQ